MTRPLADAGVWVLRADAAPRVGAGHVVRCLTLGEAVIHAGGAAILVSHELPLPLRERAALTGVTVLDVEPEPGSPADADATAAVATDADVLVLDGYRLGPSFRSALSDRNPTLVCIDDNLECDPRDVDVIINHGPQARAEDYAGRATVVLLGTSYALLRREVTDLIPVIRGGGPARRAVVSLGGTDVLRATASVCRELLERTDLELTVAVGLANPHAGEVEALASEQPDRVLRVPSDALPAALAAADIGVLGAGGTLWEAAALGLPTIAVVAAPNQRPLARTGAVRSFATVQDLTDDATAATVGEAAARLSVDRRRRVAASAAGSRLVDGGGAARVVGAVLGARASGIRRHHRSGAR